MSTATQADLTALQASLTTKVDQSAAAINTKIETVDAENDQVIAGLVDKLDVFERVGLFPGRELVGKDRSLLTGVARLTLVRSLTSETGVDLDIGVGITERLENFALQITTRTAGTTGSGTSSTLSLKHLALLVLRGDKIRIPLRIAQGKEVDVEVIASYILNGALVQTISSKLSALKPDEPISVPELEALPITDPAFQDSLLQWFVRIPKYVAGDAVVAEISPEVDEGEVADEETYTVNSAEKQLLSFNAPDNNKVFKVVLRVLRNGKLGPLSKAIFISATGAVAGVQPNGARKGYSEDAAVQSSNIYDTSSDNAITAWFPGASMKQLPLKDLQIEILENTNVLASQKGDIYLEGTGPLKGFLVYKFLDDKLKGKILSSIKFRFVVAVAGKRLYGATSEKTLDLTSPFRLELAAKVEEVKASLTTASTRDNAPELFEKFVGDENILEVVAKGKLLSRFLDTNFVSTNIQIAILGDNDTNGNTFWKDINPEQGDRLHKVKTIGLDFEVSTVVKASVIQALFANQGILQPKLTAGALLVIRRRVSDSAGTISDWVQSTPIAWKTLLAKMPNPSVTPSNFEGFGKISFPNIPESLKAISEFFYTFNEVDSNNKFIQNNDLSLEALIKLRQIEVEGKFVDVPLEKFPPRSIVWLIARLSDGTIAPVGRSSVFDVSGRPNAMTGVQLVTVVNGGLLKWNTVAPSVLPDGSDDSKFGVFARIAVFKSMSDALAYKSDYTNPTARPIISTIVQLIQNLTKSTQEFNIASIAALKQSLVPGNVLAVVAYLKNSNGVGDSIAVDEVTIPGEPLASIVEVSQVAGQSGTYDITMNLENGNADMPTIQVGHYNDLGSFIMENVSLTIEEVQAAFPGDRSRVNIKQGARDGASKFSFDPTTAEEGSTTAKWKVALKMRYVGGAGRKLLFVLAIANNSKASKSSVYSTQE